MKKVVFVCDLKYPNLWKDGLWAALQVLQNEYDLSIINLHERIESEHNKRLAEADIILAWSAFGGSCDLFLRRGNFLQPKALLIGGTAAFPHEPEFYDILLYETEWYSDVIAHTGTKKIHAFGINTDIYSIGDADTPPDRTRPFDWITVGAFSLWKRQDLILNKTGTKIAIGEVQKENRAESYAIIQRLVEGGVIISDMMPPENLAEFYRMSKKAYIPCELHGGGERAVLEARACGLEVEVEQDNPKLIELTMSPIYDHHYYAKQLKKGIEYVT